MNILNFHADIPFLWPTILFINFQIHWTNIAQLGILFNPINDRQCVCVYIHDGAGNEIQPQPLNLNYVPLERDRDIIQNDIVANVLIQLIETWSARKSLLVAFTLSFVVVIAFSFENIHSVWREYNNSGMQRCRITRRS